MFLAVAYLGSCKGEVRWANGEVRGQCGGWGTNGKSGGKGEVRDQGRGQGAKGGQGARRVRGLRGRSDWPRGCRGARRRSGTKGEVRVAKAEVGGPKRGQGANLSPISSPFYPVVQRQNTEKLLKY